MAGPNDETHIDDIDATGASKEGVGRWVLLIGTLIGIVLLSAVWIIGAASQSDIEEEATVSGTIRADENDGSDTDGIVEPDGGDLDIEEEAVDSELSTIPN